MEEQSKESEVINAAAPVEEKTKTSNGTAEQKKTDSKIPLIIAAVVLVIAGLVYLFIRLSPETTGKIRDITLVLFVLESIVTLTALVVLVVQAARLINFLKYDVDPILKTTDKTVKKLSGTISFLCDNAVEPTVKASSTISGIKNAADGVLGLFKK